VDANRALGWGKDERNHGLAAGILLDLGLKTVRLLTNNPEKLSKLRALGIEIVERVPLVYPPNGVNNSYLETKSVRLGHLLV
jgi:GTP cyclohydrolase II